MCSWGGQAGGRKDVDLEADINIMNTSSPLVMPGLPPKNLRAMWNPPHSSTLEKETDINTILDVMHTLVLGRRASVFAKPLSRMSEERCEEAAREQDDR